MNQFLFFLSRPRFEITNQFSFDNLQFFIRCCIALMTVFKRIMFLPWSHYRDSKWHLFISYEYSNFKKKIIRKQNYIFLDDSMEFIIRQIQISLRKNYYCALFKISLIFKTKYMLNQLQFFKFLLYRNCQVPSKPRY